MSGKPLLERLYDDPRVLNSAWEQVRTNAKKLSRGVDDETLLQFASNSEKRLRTIRTNLKKGKFKFSKLRASSVLKRDGSPRPIQVSAIQDRVVLKAIETLIRRQLDNEYNIFNNPVSYAYIRTEDIKDYDELDPQTYKGVRGAVEKLKNYVEDGYTWCVKADIIDFFPTIEQNEILTKYVFPVLEPDKSLNSLIESAFKVEVEISADIRRIFGDKTDDKFEAGTGLPQGSILSPLFANVYMNEFDSNMSNSGYIVIRYVDDFLILCKSKKDSLKAIAVAKDELSKIGLTIHDPEIKNSKTQILKTEDVTFLGIRLKDKKFYPGEDAYNRFIEKLSLAPKFRVLSKNLQYIQSLSQSWGATYSFCSNDIDEYKRLNKALFEAVERTLYKSRVRAIYPNTSRQLRRLGLRKFDDSVAFFNQRRAEKLKKAEMNKS